MHARDRVFGLSAGLLAAALVATPVPAQTNTGEIGGVVLDGSGGVLPGATVVATHPASGFTAERVTDADGRFFIPSLPIGEWHVTVELPGFRALSTESSWRSAGRSICRSP